MNAAAIRKLSLGASRLLIAVAAAGLIAMVLIIGWQVIGRYALGSSPSWSEQAAQVLMIWFAFLAAAAGVREGFHIRIVALEEAVSPRARRLLQIASGVIVAGCALALAVWGGELVMRTWSHVIPSLGWPRGLAYLAMPISGVLMFVFAVEQLLDPGALPPTPAPEVD